MCANSISPRASPSDETIYLGPRHRPVCVAHRVAKSSQHPVLKVFGQLDFKPQNLHFFLEGRMYHRVARSISFVYLLLCGLVTIFRTN